MRMLMMMMMRVESSVECLVGETDILRENLLECRFVHHRFSEVYEVM
jgi:hypothetical protein